jgi:hypothetical protein
VCFSLCFAISEQIGLNKNSMEMSTMPEAIKIYTSLL